MIKQFEFYHGVVFTKLVHCCKENILIKPYPSSSNASYILNDQIGLYIKHSTKRMSPWRFNFQKDHQNELFEMKSNLNKIYLILVCGYDGIVTLSYNELKIILDDSRDEIEWISAARNRNQEYTVNGSNGGLGSKIGKSDFAKKIFSETPILLHSY